MLSRMSRLAALAVALAAPAAYAAPDKGDSAAKKGPAVLVRVQSVNDLLKTADYIGTLLPEEAREPAQAGDRLRQGHDRREDRAGRGGRQEPDRHVRHLRRGVRRRPRRSSSCPVADRDVFLNTLEQTAKLKVEAPKDKDGVYKTEPADVPFPVYFRFANGYAYATLGDAANIDTKTLAKPADVLGGRPEHLVSATLRIDRLPDGLKKMAIAGAENLLAKGKEQPIPDELRREGVQGQGGGRAGRQHQGVAGGRGGGGPAAERRPEGRGVRLRAGADREPRGRSWPRTSMSIRENKSVAGGALRVQGRGPQHEPERRPAGQPEAAVPAGGRRAGSRPSRSRPRSRARS